MCGDDLLEASSMAGMNFAPARIVTPAQHSLVEKCPTNWAIFRFHGRKFIAEGAADAISRTAWRGRHSTTLRKDLCCKL
jgi:hypothetical protein